MIAFIVSDPDRVRCALHAGRKELAAQASDADGWGVGFYQGGEVLLQRRPKGSGPLDFSKIASDIRTDILVGHVRHATVGAPKIENTHPFRFRSWLFAHHGTIPRWDEVRADVTARVPKFLQRNIRGETDSEVLFHLVLANLHETARLDDPTIPPKVVMDALRAALATVEEIAKQPAEAALVATNGRLLVGLRQGAPVWYYAVDGLRDCEVCRAAAEPGREGRRIDHEHLRAVVLTTGGVAPTGAPWVEMPDRTFISVEHDDGFQLVPR